MQHIHNLNTNYNKGGFNLKVDNLLSSAYDTYSNVLYVVNTVADADFISISEFADLLKTILDCPKFEPYFINKILIDKKVIIKNSAFDRSNITSIKYLPVDRTARYYKITYIYNRPFLIWSFHFLSSIFSINFQSQLTKQNAKNFYHIICKYIHIDASIDDVFDNLIKLQLLLYAEKAI